jgi:hypothetical protein
MERIFTQIGKTLYYAQCLEQQLKITIGIVLNKNHSRQTPTERESEIIKLDKKTLGFLFKELKKTTIPPNLQKSLDTALDMRNELAHDFFWKHQDILKTEDGIAAALDYLVQMEEIFTELDDYFCKLADRWLELRGVDPIFKTENGA